ncbi:MAG: cobaltochelatase subunit CobN [Candidatus Desulfofervidaceae bacterium]|nr:cobaltochelatase subunit CobN [Candidatus Desulfofervidaceae bacterium]
MQKIKLAAIMWSSHVGMLVRACQKLPFLQAKIFSNYTLSTDENTYTEAINALEEADLILLYRSSEAFWDSLEPELKRLAQQKPLICLSHDPAYWVLSSVQAEVVTTAHRYLNFGGEENFFNLVCYILKEALGYEIDYQPPKDMPWQGIYHPRADKYFNDVESYLAWYQPKDAPTVGLLISRYYWVNRTLDIEDTLIEVLESLGLNVIPAFSYSTKDESVGAKGSAQVIKEYFLRPDGTPCIDALIKLQAFFLGRETGEDLTDPHGATTGAELLKQLGVPVFQPVVSYHKTISEWEKDPQGLGAEIGWSVAMPEFEGVIEPIIVGAARKFQDNITGTTVEERTAIKERCQHLAERVKKWVELRYKPKSQRKIAFILHNNPCASVEASVGGGAHLDTLESVARILNRLKAEGYEIAHPPKDGKELIETIMSRKAISEFRWTTVEEIVNKGGALALLSLETYQKWFDAYPDKVKKRICEVWGNPPGEPMHGVPAAMVYDGKIVVTGVSYGNAVVCVQPKRGCAGSRCDGRVCKILHDPDVPPPHQYIATYRYLQDIFGVDVIVHVGTHGNLEFLPGKGVGLSAACFPDLAIDRLPHLYIYNSDNPPEGVIAKRRSYATLVDHMQTVLVESGLYEGLAELERLLDEYQQAQIGDRARAHTLEHMILDKMKDAKLDKEIHLEEDMPFGEIVKRLHEVLTRIRSSQTQDGMHIFGELPKGEKRVEFIRAILRYDDGEGVSFRRALLTLMGLDIQEVLNRPDYYHPVLKLTYGQLLSRLEELSKSFIRTFLNNPEVPLEKLAQEVMGDWLKEKTALPQLALLKDKVLEINRRIEASKEVDSLLRGFAGGYIPPGPSGLITRGRPDVLPTGRNFYSLDPQRVPTKAAWRVGMRLAEATLAKHLKEEGRYPENIGFYWMCTDIMWSDGEGMAQIMYLLGVRPIWRSNGRVKSFEIIPLEELKRPRIDVTIRVSGITRDNFPNCIGLIDEAIMTVASLDEPVEMNFVRKHTLEQLNSKGKTESHKEAWREATYRIFASKPGTYMAGVNLAVYASAWKEEKDLADIFVYWNGYAYGKDVFGKPSHQQLIENLKTVEATFNKVVSDEYDLFGCCCYFGTHGGLTAAAKVYSGKEIKAYYGDTRDPEKIEVNDLADEIRRVVRTKLLNPKWIEGMKRHGYKGAGDISKRIGRVFGWEATTQQVDDWIFDDIARKFVLDEEMRDFFQKNNPWAMEEISRRLLEAHERGLWQADPEVLERLQETYLEIEGWLEEDMGDTRGEFQGGMVDVITAEEIENWARLMQKALADK